MYEFWHDLCQMECSAEWWDGYEDDHGAPAMAHLLSYSPKWRHLCHKRDTNPNNYHNIILNNGTTKILLEPLAKIDISEPLCPNENSPIH